jgi:hypothetical protein
MLITLTKKFCVVLSISLLAAGQSAYGKMYRWVDDKGEVYYSDQVPPDHAKHKRQTLNESARIISVEEAAKTKAQWEREKRLQILKLKQARMIAKQKADDKVLLATFRNVTDMRTTLEVKIMATNALVNVSRGNSTRLKQQLQEQQKKAAFYERNGKTVPKKLLNEIHSSKKQIKLTNLEIAKYKAKKEIIRKEFEIDIKRFMYLSQSSMENNDLSEQITEQNIASLLGLFTCMDGQQCDMAWNYAREYVIKHSTTPIDTDSNFLIMSADPTLGDDISLSVSKMGDDQTRMKIFLDIRCRKSSLGKELCASKKVSDIRSTFSQYLQSALTAEQKRSHAFISKQFQ